MSFAWKGFHSFGGGFSPSFGPSLTGGITPIGSWDASTSTLAQLAALVSHSRTSLATMFDSTGKLTYAPNNLLTQSNTFSNAAWTKSSVTVAGGVSDPIGGTAASTITATAGGGLLRQDITVSGAATTNGVVSVWARRRTGSGAITLYKPDASNTTVPSLTGSWQQFSAAGVGAGSTFSFVIQFATNGDAIDIYAAGVSAVTWETLASQRPADQVITTSSAYYGPRIDYDPNTLAVKGLLIEEARTNIALQSSDLSNAAWQLSDTTGTLPTVTANAGTALTGLNTAAKVSINRSNVVDRNGVYQLFTGTSAPYTGTFWVKAFDVADIGKQITVRPFNGTTVGTVATITLTSSYQPVSATQTMAAAVCTFLVGYTENIGSQTGPVSFLVSGAQFEAGSFATSYIPTAAASVTRAADVVQFTGAALTALQGSAWSAAVQFADVASYAGNPSIFDTSSNLQTVFMNGNKAAFFPTSLNTANGLSVLASHRIAASATRSGGRSIVSDGGTVATDATAMTSPPNTYLGSNVGAGNFLNGHVASFAIYNQRLPDGTLQSKSVVGASY